MTSRYFLDVVIVILYLTFCFIFGFYKIKKIKNIEEYSVGDRNFSNTALFATIVATAMGAGSCIGAIAKIYEHGLVHAIPLFFTCISWIIMGKVLSHRLSAFKNFISLSEIMHFLYGSVARWVSSIAIIIIGAGMVSIQITATSHALYYYFKIGHETGLLISVVIIVAYSIRGGFRSIVLTDLFQGALFFLVFPAVCAIILRDSFVEHKVFDLFAGYQDVIANKANLVAVTTGAFYWIFPGFSAPYVQRALAAKNKRQIMNIFYLAALFTFLYTSIIILIGLIMRSNGLLVTERSFCGIISSYLPFWINGFFISAILAVTMSTADSWLNTSSSVLARDVFGCIFPKLKKRTELFLARMGVVFVSVIALIFSIYNRSIMDKLWLIKNFWNPVIVVPLVAGLLGVRASKRSFICGAVAGALFTVLGRIISSEFGLLSLIIGTLANVIVFFLAHIVCDQKSFSMRAPFGFVQNKVKTISANLSKPYSMREIASVLIFFAIESIFIPFLAMFGVEFRYNFIETLRVLCILCLLLSPYYLNKILQCKIKYLFNFILIICFVVIPIYHVLSSWLSWSFLLSAFLSTLCLYVIVGIDRAIILLLTGFVVLIFFYCGGFFILKGHYFIDSNMYLAVYLCVMRLGFIMYLLITRHAYHMAEISLLSAVACSVAHDLRRPLSLLQNYIYILGRYRIQKPEIKKVLVKMALAIGESAVTAESGLINLNTTSSNIKKCNLSELVQGIIDTTAFEGIKKAQVDLKIQKNVFVNINEALFSRVMVNLLKNAFEAISNDGAVSVKIFKKKEKSFLSIKDNGCGIRGGDLDKLFQPFFTDKKNGNGIGLAFCQNALESMNATIECHSKYGEYTEFLIVFFSK